MSLVGEIKSNYDKFDAAWQKQASANWKSLESQPVFEESYRRVCVFGALRHQLVEAHATPDAHSFALEAQNDALVAHVLARTGAWRSSMQSLRSYLENSLNCLYYIDHPVECRLWKSGKGRMPFAELLSYLKSHPDVGCYADSNTGLATLKHEYSELSKAVHGSATTFRMTEPAKKILLWSTEKSDVGSWSARERKTHEGVCLLYIHYFRDRLTGTQLSQLRELLAFCVTKSKAKALKTEIKVNIQAAV